MDIIVCIKQVPDTTEVKINPETNTLVREGVPSIINPFDENAVEEALRLREKNGGKVTVITMGPPQAKEALKQAIAGDTAQVGPGIAEWLNISQVTFAVKIELTGTTIKVERLLEELNEVVIAPLPCLLTVVKQINEPRVPSLKGMMKAKKT